MRLIFVITIFLTTCFTTTYAQGDFFTVGLEGQQYPTGYLPGIRAELGLSDHISLSFRLGANIFDHENFGVQFMETGSGSGASVGLRYYFSHDYDKFFIGVRSDFWRNRVDWQDFDINDQIIEGTSNIIVVQPTVIGGYVFQLGDHFRITPTLAGGFEWNVQTEGEPTGEGAILLWGLNLEYRI